MSKIILLAMLLAVVATTMTSARVLDLEKEVKSTVIPLLRFDRERNDDGSYKFDYEGGDGSARKETSHVVDAGKEDETLEVAGSYRFFDANGKEVVVHYTAGKRGFVPYGGNIPKEISEAAQLAADAKDEKEDKDPMMATN